MGIGTADVDGTYGLSLFEDFISLGILEIPMISICIEPTGDGYVYFSSYGNGSYPLDESKIDWFE
jgi:hypothetical protein